MQASRSSTEPLANHVEYRKLHDLNKGSYGFVVLAQHRASGEQVAIKFMERGGKISKYTSREIINHSNLLHPHIVQFKEVFLTEHHLAIVMEYAPGGDMFQHVKNKRGLDESEARWFFQQLIVGMDFMHKMGVVNRDIKLENTLLDGSRRPLVKICDFGYSKHARDSLPKSKVGTPGYTAPEIISNRYHYDGKKVDIWSAGVMLYVMLFCEYPFERPSDARDPCRFQNILQRILAVDYRLPPNRPITPELKDLLARILVADPCRRITLQQIQQHPWYLKDMPPGLLTFNDTLLAQVQQTPAEAEENAVAIRHIVREAKRLHGQPSLERHASDDSQSIDAAIDNDDDTAYGMDTVWSEEFGANGSQSPTAHQ